MDAPVKVRVRVRVRVMCRLRLKRRGHSCCRFGHCKAGWTRRASARVRVRVSVRRAFDALLATSWTVGNGDFADAGVSPTLTLTLTATLTLDSVSATV